MTPMIPPILDFATGKLGGAELVEKSTTLADLQGLFADSHAVAALSPDTRLYRVAMLPGHGGEGDLNMGVTYLEAGRVGREFFMTRGHLHARDLVLIVDDDDLLPRLCPHDVHEVMRIRTADLDGIREDALVEKSSHCASPRLMTIAAQPLSSMTLSMAKPCERAASVTSATRSSMMPEASR